MSWVQKLYDTYENNVEVLPEEEKTKLWPISHTVAQAHIEIVLDREGNYIRSSVIPEEHGWTLMPATEDSDGRTSGGAPHPLCDKIQYVAGDYAAHGGKKSAYFEDFGSKKEKKDGYLNTLRKWTEFSGHPRLKAILTYICKQCMVRDLVADHILCVDEQNKLLLGWTDKSKEKPDIFKAITSPEKDQGAALVRWRVELGMSDKATGTWEDPELIDSWIQYYKTIQTGRSLCCLTGKEAVLAVKHPSKIRNAADRAKLISSNDERGFTFRGNFKTADQAAAMSYEYMQKSYNALRWLIGKQGYRNEEQVIVTWEVSGKEIPSPMQNSYELSRQMAEKEDGKAEKFSLAEDGGDEEEIFSLAEDGGDEQVTFSLTKDEDDQEKIFSPTKDEDDQEKIFSPTKDEDNEQATFSLTKDEDNEQVIFSLADVLEPSEDKEVNTGEPMALVIKNAVKGKYTEAFKEAIQKRYDSIDTMDQIVVMGLDSASPGRLSITYYRELLGSEFLERLIHWHTHFVWHQNYAKEMKFIGTPSPADIALAAYGKRIDGKLKKATIQRILPCIIDQTAFPKDLVDSAFYRVCRRAGIDKKDKWEWEKALGITCALFRGIKESEGYDMALEENRKTKDYLYGRLLAVAEIIENTALFVAGEQRETNAARMMNRFADKPHSTWLLIESALRPYKVRLLNRRPASYRHLCDLLDTIHDRFDPDEYRKDTKLSAEFLLGYHCQRKALFDQMKAGKEKSAQNGSEKAGDGQGAGNENES